MDINGLENSEDNNMTEKTQAKRGVERKDGSSDNAEQRNPALTIVFQSWATPIIGVVMLAVGLLGGYFGRPLILPNSEVAVVGNVEEEPQVEEDISVSQDANREAQKAAVMDTLLGETRHFLGDEDAPVTIIEFSDFQCPYCEKWSNETGAEIKKRYIEEGLVRLGYWHFPFLGNQSVWAAEASECAADQDSFWAYHDYLYQPTGGEGGKSLNKENLKQIAVELNLDAEAFNECLDSGKFTQVVQGQRSVAQQIGVSSTPTFLINGEPVVGAQPFPAFEKVIEQELSASSD